MDQERRSEWWYETAIKDCRDYEKKRAEYGSIDLEIMGEAMERLAEKHNNDGVERALGFYLLGKVARMVSAWEAGHAPSDDTLKDISTYSMMLRLLREIKDVDATWERLTDVPAFPEGAED